MVQDILWLSNIMMHGSRRMLLQLCEAYRGDYGFVFVAASASRRPSAILQRWNYQSEMLGQSRKCALPVTVSQRCIHTDSSDNQSFPPPDGQGNPKLAPHFRVNNPLSSSVLNVQPSPVWEELELYGVSIEHKKPRNAVDRLAYLAVRLFKFGGNLVTGYYRGKPTEKKWLRRILFIESFSAVPGWVAAMTSHMKSFYKIQRDHGWLHTFLEESQNERMHLMTAFDMRQPGWGLRLGILAAQGVYVSLYFISYLISPRYCHRFVGYMAEENVKAYTELIKELDEGILPRWSKKVAPDLAKRYWNLPAEARIRDVVLCMRADEDHHRQVNHRYSDIHSTLVKNIQLHTLDKPVK